jgi:hypothetical protein
LDLFVPRDPSTSKDAPDESIPHVAIWPFNFNRSRAVYDSAPGDVTPHPAVARIIVAEDGATAFGSGTLIGVRDNHGLVVTNWHVVRDAVGTVEVVFPDGFRSNAKPLKVDSDWDLAALVIWRPKVDPVKIATQPPRPGELLTIHGYGRGKYRIATGHCTTYYAPQINYPHEMVELDVQARQGDSGGPIFNQQGELAGVLFGAGQGTTLGSFSPRVRYFLASVAPDLEQQNSKVIADRPAPSVILPIKNEPAITPATYPSSPWAPPTIAKNKPNNQNARPQVQLAGAAAQSQIAQPDSISLSDFAKNGWYDPLKTIFAAIGLIACTRRVLKTVR